jgi:hypothetical protein
MSRQKRIEEYSKPASEIWWDGRSNKPAIDRWSRRAETNSDSYKHKPLGGEVRLPTTGEMNLHSTHVRPGDGNDARREAKRDLNHDPVATLYAKGIRRNA